MRVFFTTLNQPQCQEKEVDAIDIVTNKYVIHIRISGIQIICNITKEIIKDENIDLTGEMK